MLGGDNRAAVIDADAALQLVFVHLLAEDLWVDRHARADRDGSTGVDKAKWQLACPCRAYVVEIDAMAGVGADTSPHAQRCLLAPRQEGRDLAFARVAP